MKKHSIFLVIIIILSAPSISANESHKNTDIKQKVKYDFRRTNWGMTKQQVLASETIPVLDNNKNGIFYKTDINNLNVMLGYIFNFKGKLYSTGYAFMDSYSNLNDYIYKYEEIKSILGKKYHKPTTDEKFWRNDLYRNDPEQYGFAISLGHLVYTSEWEVGNTKVVLLLSGNNYKFNFILKYTSIPMAKVQEKELQILKKAAAYFAKESL